MDVHLRMYAATQINEIVRFNASIPHRLIDLNMKCLHNVLQHLDISDLVILATANLTNHKDLDQAFTMETSAKAHPFEASIRDRFLQLGYTDCVTNNPDCITFEKTVFRYFGTLISGAGIYYDPTYHRHNAKIEEVISKYGSTLTEIRLINADVSAFEDIRIPFYNVTELKFEDGWLGQTFCELHKWFPNLKSLTLIYTKICDRSFFVKQEHPNLIVLSVRNKYLCQCYRMNRNALADNVLHYVLSNFHLKRFLNTNPQLRYLTLYHDREDSIYEESMRLQPHEFLIQINFHLLEYIANTLPQLCYLKLNIQEMRSFRFNDVATTMTHLTTYPTLETLVIETSQLNQLTQLNIVSGKLIHLEITVYSPIQDYELLYGFVSRFNNIESLSIGLHPVTVDDDAFVCMVKCLVNLKILQLALYKYNFTDCLFFIVKKFDRLHTVRIHCIGIESMDTESFVNSVNENFFFKFKNWRGTCISEGFEFNKC